MTASKKARPFRYTGELGYPTSRSQLMDDYRDNVRDFEIDNPDATEAERKANSERVWKVLERAHRRRLMIELQRYWNIDPKDPEAAMKLAWALALTHVPAFQFGESKRRGRPPKSPRRQPKLEPLSKIVQWPPKAAKRDRRGAPTVWTVEEYRKLLDHLEKGKAKLRAKGKKVTNLAALIEYAMEHKRAKTANFGSWTDAEIRAEAKLRAARVADARKALRKISEL